MVPSLPGPVVGETQQPGIEFIANSWSETLLISLYHLETERERVATKMNLGDEFGGQFGWQGLLPSSTRSLLLARGQGDLGPRHLLGAKALSSWNGHSQPARCM